MKKVGLWLLCAVCLVACDNSIPVNQLDLERWSQKAAHNIDFVDFIAKVAQTSGRRELTRLVDRYQAKQALSELDSQRLIMLAGIYARGREKDNAVKRLSQLVALDTRSSDHTAPDWAAMDTLMQEMAKDADLRLTIDPQGRYYLIDLPGVEAAKTGIYGYINVAGIDAVPWQAVDNKVLQPFEMVTVRKRYYGRGTEFNKGPVVAMIFAMKAVKEMGLALDKGFRFYIDRQYPSDADKLSDNLKEIQFPERVITLLGEFPVMIGQQGQAQTSLIFNKRTYDLTKNAVIAVSATDMPNHVPAKATAIISTKTRTALEDRLQLEIKRYTKKYSGSYRIDVAAVKKGIALTVTGIAGHVAFPDDSVNALQHLFNFLSLHQVPLKLANNAYLDAASFSRHFLGVTSDGSMVGLNFKDTTYGKSSLQLIHVKNNPKSLQLGLDMRYPQSQSQAALKEALDKQISFYRNNASQDFTWQTSWRAPRLVDATQPWVREILNLYNDRLRRRWDAKISPMAVVPEGFKEGIAFGPVMPGAKPQVQRANEHITVKAFEHSLQMYTELLLTLGKVKSLTQ